MSNGDNLGTWIYRSFLSPDELLGWASLLPPELPANKKQDLAVGVGLRAVSNLIWAEGVADLSESSGDQLRGTLHFAKGLGLALTGTVAFDADGNPSSIQIDARLNPVSEAPNYQLRGSSTGPWADNQTEVPTVVGSIIYRGGVDPDPADAGTVGSFILVKTAKTVDDFFASGSAAP